jgi:hypothetical protein
LIIKIDEIRSTTHRNSNGHTGKGLITVIEKMLLSLRQDEDGNFRVQYWQAE